MCRIEVGTYPWLLLRGLGSVEGRFVANQMLPAIYLLYKVHQVSAAAAYASVASIYEPHDLHEGTVGHICDFYHPRLFLLHAMREHCRKVWTGVRRSQDHLMGMNDISANLKLDIRAVRVIKQVREARGRDAWVQYEGHGIVLLE